MTGEETSMEIFLDTFPPHASESVSRLRVQYAILSLYKAGVAIAQGGKFCHLNATLYMRGDKIGWFEYRPRQTPLTLDYANNSSVMADSGTIFDPDDRRFAIRYEWDRVRIKASDVFTTMMDGFAIAAQHNNSHLNAYIPAARSASGDTVFSTWVVGDVNNQQMTWAKLKKALLMIWDLLIIGRGGAQRSRFEGFIIRLQYEGKDLMAGRMMRFGPQNDARGLER